ncbi:hypothetical protein GCM10010401_02400 [Rarobacter faecitabidus]|uniref:Cell division protein FtsL n=1 Tax=Rarobacter faecitabidus TaxID=13243 RepID=A0A542ZW88_RARFA|nr:hypothetical protein [Rarobacter faecitabidus]TQL64624.1 hypothetical protein FB461_1133 [Rarobacter faecitabidus]
MSLAQPLPPARPQRRIDRTGSTRTSVRPPAAERPHLEVIPSTVPDSGRFVFLILCMILLGLGLFGSLALNTMMAQGSYQQASLQRQLADEAQSKDMLQTHLNFLNTPENLAKSAKKLGMSQQQAPLMIRLQDKQIIGLTE